MISKFQPSCARADANVLSHGFRSVEFVILGEVCPVFCGKRSRRTCSSQDFISHVNLPAADDALKRGVIGIREGRPSPIPNPGIFRYKEARFPGG